MLGALGAAARRRAGRRARQRADVGFFGQPVLRHRRRLPRRPGGARRQPRRRAARPAAGGDAGDPPRVAAARSARRCRRPARRSAARGASTRSCAASRSCRAAPRSACAASARRKRRTLATALQVALAVGALLALLALGTSVGNITREYYDDTHFDVFAGTVATRPFNARGARASLATTPGVTAHPAAAEHERQGRRQGRRAVGMADRR